MNKYHGGHLARWFARMIYAGWRFWAWQDPAIMWRHSDENGASITLAEGRDLFKQYVNTGGKFIPDPYEQMADG